MHKIAFKVIDKLEEEFGFRLRGFGTDFTIHTFKGRQDADEFRWYTIGLSPEIQSRLTMTEFVKNKKAVYSYNSWNSEGVIIDEGAFAGDFPKDNELPTFTYSGGI